MNPSDTFRRSVGLTMIVGTAVAIASIFTSLAWIAPDMSTAFTDPAAGLQSGPGHETVARWSMVLDMLGYYLVMIPIALYLRAWLRRHKPNLVDFCTIGGIAYALIGAAGAAVLAMAAPYLLDAYAGASGARKEAIEVVYPTLMKAVQHGLWMTLQPIPAGIWWLGIGSVLIAERRVLGWFTVVLGALALVTPIGMALAFEPLGPTGLGGAWGVLQLIWMLWIGVSLLITRPAESGAPARLETARSES